MATVGQQLTAPEAGWKRYDDRNSNISYIGGAWATDALSGEYNTTTTYIPEGTSVAVINASSIKFNFTGTAIRFIQALNQQHSKMVSYKIDGVLEGTANLYTSTSLVRQTLAFEKTGLDNKEHYVEVYSGDGIRFDFDAIDIDETGKPLPYNPAPDNPEEHDNAILRVTMIDSSEREYKLPKSDIDAFVTWFTRTVGTGTSVYVLNKMTSSKEYLAFDKIISFEVIPVA